MTGPVIAFAADHAGFELKNSMKFRLRSTVFLSSTSGQRPPIPSTIRTWPASWRPHSRMTSPARREEAPDMHTGFALLSLALLTLAAPAGATELMTASQVAQALGFDRAAEQKLLAGIPSIR